MTALASISLIVVDTIRVPAGRRRIDPSWVETLASLMTSPADCQPIEVVAADTGYDLVFGAHRLAAAKRNGWSTVPAIVRDRTDFADEAAIRLREITENLARRELSVLDRAVDIARWREIYEATQLVAKRGRPKNSAKLALISDDHRNQQFAESFSSAAQRVLDLSHRNLFRCIKIASIPAAIRDRIALHAIADNQSELLSLAAEPHERQTAIAALLTSEPSQATSVAGAIDIIDRAPKAKDEPRWQKLASGFSRLKEREQDAFFDLHEAAIARWQKARSAQ